MSNGRVYVATVVQVEMHSFIVAAFNLLIPDSGPALLRHGVRQRRRAVLSSVESACVSGGKNSILWRRDNFRTWLLAPKQHCLP